MSGLFAEPLGDPEFWPSREQREIDAIKKQNADILRMIAELQKRVHALEHATSSLGGGIPFSLLR
jgi:hypothetical protein